MKRKLVYDCLREVRGKKSEVRRYLKASKQLVIKLIILLSIYTFQSFSQGVGINTSGLSADVSSILDISSTSQGLLIPRMTTTQRNNIASPATSLLIFNITTNCFEAYVNGTWYSVSCPPACMPPAIPIAGTQNLSSTQIVWKWNSVSGSTGYKWNSVNDFNSAVDNETSTLYKQSGLTCNTNYTLYIWAYNSCGNSSSATLVQATTFCRNCGGSGIICTIAGSSYGDSGDGGLATSAHLKAPWGVAVDSLGNVYIADESSSRIRKISYLTGIISTVAGTATQGYNGDGIAATDAELGIASDMRIDIAGNMYIADQGNNRVRKVDASTGIISTIAGNGTYGSGGDGGPATNAQLAQLRGIAVDRAGNVFISDFRNNRIRKVDAITGIIKTIAGNGSSAYNGDGIPATSASLSFPWGLAIDDSGNIFIADDGNYRIRKVDISTGLISTIAGTGTYTYNGDGIAATNAAISCTGIALDFKGNLYISDLVNNRIRKVDALTGIISSVAGTGGAGFSGDGGPATNAQLWGPICIAVDSYGNIIFGDDNNSRVREIYR
jgi:hypothetical protein